MLNHSGYIFCPAGELYRMILGPGRFNVVTSACVTHTLRTSFVFLMTLHKNYSYLDLEHLTDKTFYGISSVDSDLFTMYVDSRILYICSLFFFCTDYLVVEKTREFPNSVFILRLNSAKSDPFHIPQILSTPS